jgi:hypothetical protein
VEGVKKAARLAQEGMNAVGVAAVWNWKRGGKAVPYTSHESLIPDLVALAIPGRRFTLCFGSDIWQPDKPECRLGVYALGRHLEQAGAIVRVMQLPQNGTQKVGADDYLLSHSLDDFRAVMEAAIPLTHPALADAAEFWDKKAITSPLAALPIPINAADWLDSDPAEPGQILEDFLDVRDKLAIIGSSKMRKSFFLLQLLACLAAGRSFLTWRVPKARRVSYIQYEIQPNHCHFRVKRMGRALGITSTTIQDRFQIINARGSGLVGLNGIERISQLVEVHHPEIIAFDPLYKVAAGAENAAEDAKIILGAFDRLIEQLGAAVAYVHHDAKGFSGDRDIRDRGAGSSVIGRDYDACVTLTPHVAEEDAAVIEVMLRNYRPQDPFTVLWTDDEETGGYRWELKHDIAPTKETSSNRKTKDLPALPTYLPAALEILRPAPLPIGEFLVLLRTKTGLTHARSKDFRNWAAAGTAPALDTFQRRGRGVNEKLIGLTADIFRLRESGV